jgi:lipoprotein-anchoring transpeptidase ErfK/SrfK
VIIEITPQPPLGVIRSQPEAEYTPVPADTQFLPDFHTHEYEIPEEVGDSIWVEVDLGEQALYVHEGARLVAGFRISSGKPGRDTRKGLFRIYAMYPSYPVWGPIINGVPEYWIPDVPYAMFYHVDFAIHGAYWHDDFGTPVSHGCVNLEVNDAEWVYGNVGKGTYVHVHD